MKFLCRLGIHDWRPMKWGLGHDARECSRCGLFQMWVFLGFETRDRPGTERPA